jgi:D-glycero-D-manno-heptose 1,7-bisphosphate phosphatase
LKSADKFNGWALFLDRDGVINDKLENDYVKDWSEFRFQTGVLNAIADLSCIFSRIFIVTNQRGVGLGLMTEKALHEIHEKMISEIKNASGRIDQIYYCAGIDDHDECRKPNIGMALKAKQEFPDIDFLMSVMVGDSESDMEFGKRLGVERIYIQPLKSESINLGDVEFDRHFGSLFDFSESLK